jgi:hypothetical protein
MPRHRVCFGSFGVRLIGDQRYADLLPTHFRVWPTPDDGTDPDAELDILEAGEPRAPVEEVDDRLSVERLPALRRASTSITSLEVDTRDTPSRARLRVSTRGQRPDYVDHYVVMNLRFLLRLHGRLQLHGAAAKVGNGTALFLGDKGAGKSTISLALGRAGAIVLADDQLMLHDDGRRLRVSGVDGGLRVTEATERHFFARPLDAPTQDFGGTHKKEVRLGAHVAAQPGVDHEPSLLVFPRVGHAFTTTPTARVDAVRRILAAVAPLHRFADAADKHDTLRSITTLVRSVEVYDVTLSPDLDQIHRLVEFVQDRIG